MSKPTLNGKKGNLKQGIYIPRNPDKYAGNEKIIYRSSWEKRTCEWLDMNPSVIYWNSEGLVIPYLSPLDNKVHRYFIDFLAKIKTRNGELKTYGIEIKPKKETLPPTTKNKTRLITETQTYLINQAKWAAARLFCEGKGAEFIVLTEYDLGIKK